MAGGRCPLLDEFDVEDAVAAATITAPTGPVRRQGKPDAWKLKDDHYDFLDEETFKRMSTERLQKLIPRYYEGV